MNFYLTLFIGMFIGFLLGITLACLLYDSRRRDDASIQKRSTDPNPGGPWL